MQPQLTTIANFQYSCEAQIIKYRLLAEEIASPNCNQKQIQLYATVTDFKSLGSLMIGFLYGSLRFYTRYQYRCENCKHKFSIDE